MEWQKIVIGLALFFIVITTILGNLLVLIAVYREKRLQTKFNYYLVNLALTDICVAVTAMSFYTVDNILGYWPFGEFMCGVWIFCDYGMTFASVFTILVISVDRFWSVTWRMHYRIHHTKIKCLMLIFAVWVFMICLWLPPCILDRINNSTPMSCKWDPAHNREFVVVVATIGHHGACLILSFCYVKVFYVLRKRRKVKVIINAKQNTHGQDFNNIPSCSKILSPNKNLPKTDISSASNSRKEVDIKNDTNLISTDSQRLNPVYIQENSYIDETSRVSCMNTGDKKQNDQGSDNRSNERDTNNENPFYKHDKAREREAKVFKTLTYIIVGYIICWVPFHIVFDISAVMPNAVPEIVYTVTFWLTYFNSTINPFLYNFSSNEFKVAFKKIIFRK